VRVPAQLMRAMAAEAEAAREARAKVIAAEGEHKASRSLRQAAEVITDCPAALQLRYLQTLNSISAENNSTIIFPIPIDIISQLMGNPPQSSHQHHTPAAPAPVHSRGEHRDPDCSLKHLIGTEETLPINLQLQKQ